MFIQTQKNTKSKLFKVYSGKKVSAVGSLEISSVHETNNNLLKDIFSINGVESIF